jgi:two-component system chemotaxis response regulator CheY
VISFESAQDTVPEVIMNTVLKKVLLVDDDPNIRLLFKRVITKAGFALAGEAENGEDAIKLYASLTPDLTLLDISMPRMDGVEALQRILESTPEARIVMLTASSEADVIESALKMGAIAHIPKNASLEEIQRTLKEILKD